jgi:hypothetical protein
MGLGNVSVLNLNGNGSQALLGNGVFGLATAAAAGSNTEIQFNNNGALSTSSLFKYDVTGRRLTIAGVDNIAIGFSPVSTGIQTTAIGYRATATTGDGAIAIGASSNATGGYSVAIGTGAVASGDSSYALGRSANASAFGSYAIGYGVVANTANTIVLGNSSYTTMIPGTLSLTGFKETVLAPTFSTTYAPDVATGTIQKFTASANFTFNGFTNPLAGQSATIIITQGVGGSKLMTSTMKFVGGDKTLSTAAGDIDVISVFYDGTNYLASLTRGYA